MPCSVMEAQDTLNILVEVQILARQLDAKTVGSSPTGTVDPVV